MHQLTLDDVDSVPGAFWQPDLDMFRVVLEATAAHGPGDLAELGVLVGRSAVLIGDDLRDEETFTVVDLFGQAVSDASNNHENQASYPDLTRGVFEAHYRRLHDHLPVVVEGLSSTITENAAHGTHRFVHVDASHLFDHVHADIRSARTLLAQHGVLVLDDFRAEHTPGVAAAAWQAVTAEDLHPFALSPQKMYATWGDAAAYRDALLAWAAGSGHPHEIQRINDQDVLRIEHPRTAPHPAKRYVPEVAWPALNKARAMLRHGR